MSTVESLISVALLTALIGCLGFALYFYGLALMVVLGLRRPRRLPRRAAWAILAAPWLIAAAFVSALLRGPR